MQNRLMVYPVGADVKVGFPTQHDAKVTAIMIEGFNNVTYRVVWYDGKDRYERWVGEVEINVGEAKKAAIIIPSETKAKGAK